ncbi:5-formyltetrahydrofolate cyclo-ligase [Bifidobacterium sp.]|uniref:5-formyltetrahydrofolate cyclo-ligase n=1 Tax=Bifidobacterium sp. TaxID=41200 RepID=UPI0025BE6DBC|nr:5-formyltetrahydrofolate cyclo-ligase [Bifidobacterium sp.]MCH4209037.1 5-formyltetrahydrofolate cyclo-ligase [Bifidobacterium sp.]MCI1225592.1 5-formyltetrahydrofolate cyclo-ligase [Bifidobacterium sp.]
MGQRTTQDAGITAAKRALRHAALKRRRAVDDAHRTDAGERLARLAERHAANLTPHALVAAYVSMGTEVPTLPMIDALRTQGLRMLVPRLGSGLQIGWGELRDKAGLEPMPRTASGGLRPREPHGATLGPRALHDAELIIVPALAVDEQGSRLGRGGGWYDRALAERNTRARILAVCWPWEVVHGPLPRQDHDVPVDAVLRWWDEDEDETSSCVHGWRTRACRGRD